MNLIFSIKQQNNELEKMIFELETNPRVSLQLDTDDYQDMLINLEDIIERLVNTSNKYKSNSDIFMQFHKTCDDMYSNIIVLGNEVSAVASELRYKEQKLAS